MVYVRVRLLKLHEKNIKSYGIYLKTQQYQYTTETQ